MKKTIMLAFLLFSEMLLAQSKDGRFQIIQLGTMRRDQFLLDTQTGKVWQPTCLHGSTGADCEYAAFMQTEVEGISASKDKIYKNVSAYLEYKEALSKAAEKEKTEK